ncbi:MAG: phosphate ABC transporter substrate-binding protein [Lachnospiraceae bacterium]|nr:phosphate ABC transporter substrate-binding protein [Lachnospiraceae bacterium]
MRKRMTKSMTLVGAALLAISTLTGCKGQEGNGGTSGLSGTITLAGSTSMSKLAQALQEDFMAKHDNVTVSVEFSGSGAGIESVINETCDIGNASRNVKEEEKEKGVVENIVAIDGIAIVSDPANPVSDLTKEQLIQIYTGKIVNWKELGGSDTPVVVIGREAGSGTRAAFEELLEIEDVCTYANELDSTGAVMAKVASTPGAIGYVSLDVVDDSVKLVSLEGVEATSENIKAGSYLLSRPFVMATKGQISLQSELVQAWFEYVLGEEGQAIAAQVGLVTVN